MVADGNGPGVVPEEDDELAQARRQLAALDDEFTRDGFEFGFDRHGWDAWRGRPQPLDLHAGTAAELRGKVLAALGRAAS